MFDKLMSTVHEPISCRPVATDNAYVIRNQGPVSRKSRKVFGPKKAISKTMKRLMYSAFNPLRPNSDLSQTVKLLIAISKVYQLVRS